LTLEIALVLGILAVALALFVSERLPMEIVALLVLLALALGRLVTIPEALSGFSNPAVITVWAMFMISAGLTRTGVAGAIGRRVLRLAGSDETRMIIVIMLTAGGLSAFMNNIGVAAMMLPVVMDIARRTGRSPSRLLMPLAFGSLLGGLTTLIGTPPNLLVAGALQDNGLAPFRLFDFAPVGLAVLVGGTLFFALVGRHLLPTSDPASRRGNGGALTDEFALDEKTAVLHVPAGCPLVGRTLQGSRLGSAAGVRVLAIVRDGKTLPSPSAGDFLAADDRLLVSGPLDRFSELQGWRELQVEEPDPALDPWGALEAELAECSVSPESALCGRTLIDIDFRKKFDVLVLALRRGHEVLHAGLAGTALEPGDRLLVEGTKESVDALRELPHFEDFAPVTEETLTREFLMRDRLFVVRVPEGSILSGKSLAESRLGDAFSLGVIGLARKDETVAAPGPNERLASGDRLLLRGERDALDVLEGLQQLALESEQLRDASLLESEQAGLVDVILPPRTQLAGKTPRQLDFHQRYGLQVVAILRRGKTHRGDLRDVPLEFGDALLLFGPRDRQALLAEDTNFVVLTRSLQPAVRSERAPLAAGILVLALAPVVLGLIPIAIAAVAAATLMVLGGCMTMEDAYRSVQWRAVFLIAGMLPLGAAMQTSGAAAFLAEGVVGAVGPFGPWGVLIALYLVTAAGTMIIPTAALVVLMAPIVLGSASEVGLSPYAAMMALAMAASASFTSPISHPANVLVMGPGGYRFSDFIRLGGLLTIVVMVIVLLVLPVFWPLTP